jgi:hypothetical protein
LSASINIAKHNQTQWLCLSFLSLWSRTPFCLRQRLLMWPLQFGVFLSKLLAWFFLGVDFLLVHGFAWQRSNEVCSLTTNFAYSFRTSWPTMPPATWMYKLVVFVVLSLCLCCSRLVFAGENASRYGFIVFINTSCRARVEYWSYVAPKGFHTWRTRCAWSQHEIPTYAATYLYHLQMNSVIWMYVCKKHSKRVQIMHEYMMMKETLRKLFRSG